MNNILQVTETVVAHQAADTVLESKLSSYALNGCSIPSNGLHPETTKSESAVEAETVQASAEGETECSALNSAEAEGKTSEKYPVIEPESEASAGDAKELIVAVSEKTLSEPLPEPSLSSPTTSEYCIVCDGGQISDPPKSGDGEQIVDSTKSGQIADSPKSGEIALKEETEVVQPPSMPYPPPTIEEPNKQSNRPSMDQLKEQSAQQRAAIAELQENLDKAREHAKHLLAKVAELEKARTDKETADRGAVVGLSDGTSAWGTFKSYFLSVVQRVAGNLCGLEVALSPVGPADAKGCASGEQTGRGLSIARQFDNLWVRLRGGERCKSSTELNVVGGEEVDKALKLAGAQAAQALTRIEALELSISRLIETASQDFPLENEHQL
jgi:hypothetical protein